LIDLDPLNQRLRDRGVRIQLEQRKQALVARGPLPQPDGATRRGRLSLDLKAVQANLLEAEMRCLQIQKAIEDGTYPKLGWTKSGPALAPSSGVTPLSCEAAIQLFVTDYWDTRVRTPAAERTWDRIHLELRRLPPYAPCTLMTLTSTITTTTPGSRTRLECCKVFKRLARHLSLPGDLNQITRLQGNYEPARRHIPGDEAIIQLLEALHPTPWGWCYAAMATYGCRPAEVPSLVPNDDGTAQCITIKRRNKIPDIRTCFALPREWVNRFQLHDVRIPGEIRWMNPEAYDSKLGKKFVDAWRHSRRSAEIKAVVTAILPEFDLYDLRHRWAIRTIEAGKPLTLCARAMGHSAAVHEQTYHRNIQAEDLRRAMAAESV
jgi:hypothetical protein